MGKVILTMILALTFSLVNAQTSTVKCTVERGETIESIAQKHGTTVEKLKELNPEAAQFIYVGMELMVPDVNSTLSSDTNHHGISDNQIVETKKNSVSYTEDFHSKPHRSYFGLIGGISFNNYVGEDIKGGKNHLGFNIYVVGGYEFTSNIFAEVQLGVVTKGRKIEQSITSGQYWDDEDANYDGESTDVLKTTNIELPIYLGVKYEGIFAMVGPYLTYAISGKKHEKGSQTIYPDIHSSETEYIDETTKLSGIQGFKKFGCGIGGSVGYRYEQFVISATYQHGLTKLYNKSKQYEQNILVSVGIMF